MKNLIKLTAFLSVFISAFLAVSQARADMTLTPTRVVFEDRDRFAEVALINTSDETHTYEMGWQFYKMIQDQEPPYEQVEGSITDFDLSQYIVYTPRRVTLAPGGRQKVKLALRRPAEVPPGEYRAHMVFRTVPDRAAQQAETEDGKFSAGVVVNVGFSIPVIFRAGQPNETARIENVRFERNQVSGGLQALVTVTRSGGPYGVLGHLFVYDASGDVIGEISNAHIFPEVNGRTFTVQFMDDNLSGQNLRFVLKHHDLEQGKIYAEQTIPVQ